MRPGIAGRGTLPASKLEAGDLSMGLIVPPTGFAVEMAPRIGGDRVGEAMGDFPDAIEIGLGLLECEVAPVGPVESFLPLAWAEACRAIADPTGAGDSISRP